MGAPRRQWVTIPREVNFGVSFVEFALPGAKHGAQLQVVLQSYRKTLGMRGILWYTSGVRSIVEDTL